MNLTSAIGSPGVLLPGVILAVAALIVMLVEAFYPETLAGIPSRRATAGLAIVGFLTAALVSVVQWDPFSQLHPAHQILESLGDPAGMLVFDAYTAFLTIVFCVGGILAVLLSIRYLDHIGKGAGELYSLVLFATVGAYLMAAAHHLMMVFLGLEILSVSVYPLAGFLRKDQRSNEAALKYFLLGAFASAFLLYGIALIYGAAGVQMHASGSPSGPGQNLLHPGLLRFDQLAAFVQQGGSQSALFWIGVALLIVGFSFKAGLSPFHMWTPDVYDGAPTPITGFMASVVKAAAFAPFFRFFLEVLGRRPGLVSDQQAYYHWGMLIGGIAILTMTWGNLAAVAEPSMKRMLAYSSVAHAGYITLALVAQSRTALLYYMLVYTLMVVGSFGCVALLRRRSGEETTLISEWTGIAHRHPWLSAAMAVFMFSLAGFPPTAGFIGKLFIFRAALAMGAGVQQNGYVSLVVIALLNSLVSVYYYVRVVVTMYRPAVEDPGEYHVDRSLAAGLALAICAAGIILLGIFPEIVTGRLQDIFGI